MLDSIKALKAQPTNSEKADRLLACFHNEWSDQELGRIFVVSAEGRQIFDRRCTAVTDHDVRLKINHRNIVRWLDKGWRVVVVSEDIGDAADCQVSALWGLMGTMQHVTEIIEQEGGFDWADFEVDCWDRYNTGTVNGREPMIELSRVYEWLGF